MHTDRPAPTVTAITTLAALSGRIAASFVPPARATHTSATFRQVGEIAGDLPLTLADAAVGFAILGKAPEGIEEPGPMQGRRATCREVAVLAGSPEGGKVSNLTAVLRAVAAHFEGSTDPRQQTIAATATREVAELEAVGAQ